MLYSNFEFVRNIEIILDLLCKVWYILFWLEIDLIFNIKNIIIF